MPTMCCIISQLTCNLWLQTRVESLYILAAMLIGSMLGTEEDPSTGKSVTVCKKGWRLSSMGLAQIECIHLNYKLRLYYTNTGICEVITIFVL